MGRIRHHKRILGWLSALAFVCNLLAGAFYYAPAKMAQLSDEFLGPLVICTSHGAMTVPQGDGAPHPGGPADHCPACIPLAKVALAVALIFLAVFAFPLPVAARPVPIRSRALAPHLSLGGIGSRAPPLLA